VVGQGMILRVQDEAGRGPWRPGFSHQWIDQDREDGPPAMYEEVEDFHELVKKYHRLGYHIGCAVRGFAGIRLWFTRTELIKLRMMGFDIYNANEARVIEETPNQLLIGTKFAFRKLPKAMVFDLIVASYGASNEGIWKDD
jgi:hypothetical protein